VTSLLAFEPSRYIDPVVKSLPVAFHPPYLHFTAVCLLIFLIVLWFLVARLRGYFDQWWRKKNPPAPYQPQLLVYFRNAALWWSFILLFAIALVVVAVYLSGYQYIDEGVKVAGTAMHHGGSVHFRSYNGVETDYPTRGAEVAAGGIFFRFPPWMRFLGLRTYHRVVTFRGMADNQYHYTRPDANWIHGYADPIYSFLYKKGWLDAHYTESVYFPSGKHQVLVTHSGYIVR
jgi:hypothetical protein